MLALSSITTELGLCPSYGLMIGSTANKVHKFLSIYSIFSYIYTSSIPLVVSTDILLPPTLSCTCCGRIPLRAYPLLLTLFLLSDRFCSLLCRAINCTFLRVNPCYLIDRNIVLGLTETPVTHFALHANKILAGKSSLQFRLVFLGGSFSSSESS